MNAKEFTYGLIKVLAIWIFVYSFLNIAAFGLGIVVATKTTPETIAITIIQILFCLIITAVLWFYADRISDKIANGYHKAGDDHPQKLDLKQNKIIEVGSILIGFYIFIQKSPILAGVISDIIQGELITASDVSHFVPPIVSVILAIYLILGRRGILKTIRKLQTTGTEQKDTSPVHKSIKE